MAMSILGIGCVTAAGNGVDSLRKSMERIPGEDSTGFPPTQVPSSEGYPLFESDVSGLEAFVPKRALRRLGKFTKLALHASLLAVKDVEFRLNDDPCEGENCDEDQELMKTKVGIVFGTAHGPLKTTFDYQDTIIDDGDKGASPTLFSSSVHNSLASTVSMHTGFTGPSMTVSSLDRTAIETLRVAQTWIDQRRVDYVLCGMGETHCGLMGYVIDRMKNGNREPLSPFDFGRCTYTPGEGFVAFLLGSGLDEPKYGSILGLESLPISSPPDRVLLEKHKALVLAADGDLSAGTCFDKLDLPDCSAASYSHLYGSMTVGLGFALACGAISINKGFVYTPRVGGALAGSATIDRDLVLRDSDSIGCLACSSDRIDLVTIGQPWPQYSL